MLNSKYFSGSALKPAMALVLIAALAGCQSKQDKAIDQAKNRLQKALDKVNRVCSAEDIATLGVAGVIAGGAAALLFAPVGDGLPALCCP